MADKKVNEFYTRPPVLTKWEGFKQFLWNPETKQFLGRTGASWGKILLFYLIFYAVLVGFFAALLAVFYQTLDTKKPKWELDNGLIGNNPGLGFRPMPPESNVESTLIWYKSSDKGNVHYWQEELRKFLRPYHKENNPHYNNVEQCSMFVSPTPGKVCDVKMTPQKWHPCLDEAGFGFEDEKGGPCIFLKLNKIYNWYPEYYNSTNLPDSSVMSEYLRKDILDAETRNEHQMVWVTCEGENPADKENIGPLRYIPQRGFSSQYFPFKNQDGYLSPLVAVHFETPKRGVLINIECKAWAKNIIHDRIDRRGSVHFELMID
ncbi:sodium/potassium-transporting ATPase subunit beta-2 [Diorhabda carinulata]|uniref:sodium/potassium-transporting ATPase subunit beta-2 n=1 Tax=Diorhabda sublineata TaxID=1163346 RepID=UPI0024E0BEE6|nr:sodium/potassium-transporting ATPase subunit beta-2 [Diorhabda sublineata]XP_057662954.1 sodium/potassium-transporting ATPase subunit beta-2 [Diorhabda carinulata]